MAIPLTGSGSLFVTVGRVGCLVRTTDNGHLGNTAATGSATWGSGGPTIRDLQTGITNIFDELAANVNISQLANGLYSIRDDYRTVHDTYLASLANLGAGIVVTLANADVTLVTPTLPYAVQELINQMNDSSDTVAKNTVSIAVAAKTIPNANTGNPSVLTSIVSPTTGLTREYLFPEVIEAIVTTDAESSGGGATAGSENINILGEPAVGVFDYRWPMGSACRTSMTVVDYSLEAQAAGGNLMTNSSFETFTTTNTPDNWTVSVGTIGTQILEGSSTSSLRGTAKSLKIVGDGSNLTSIKQSFSMAEGTLGALSPLTAYAFTFWRKVDSTPAAGSLALELVDGSGTIIADAAATNNSATFSLTAATGTYEAVTAFFRTPANLPAAQAFQIRLASALTSSRELFISAGAFAQAVEFYVGGPFGVAFRGSTDVIITDQWNITVSNNESGWWQQLFWQLFDIPNLGAQLAIPTELQLPSAVAASATIANSLIG